MRHWVNNVRTQNTVVINPGDTTIVVQDDSRFPNNVIGGFDFGSGDTFLLTIRADPNSSVPNEIVEVTGNPSGTSYTVTRAQEGTTAQQWPVGSVVEQDLTAAAINDFEVGTGSASTVITDDSLAGDGSVGDPLGVNFGPDVFGLGGASVELTSSDDLDDLDATGWYHWIGSTNRPANAPSSANRGSIYHNQAGAATSQVVIDAFSDKYHRIRNLAGTGYSAWMRSLRNVSTNQTLVGQGTPSSPLGVNTAVFETQINTDLSLEGDGSMGNMLRVAPVNVGLTMVDNAGNQSIDLQSSFFSKAETFVNIVNASGSDFELTVNLGLGAAVTQGKKVHIINNSNSTVTIIAGTNVNWIASPAGENIDIPGRSGLVTFLVVVDFVEDMGLAFQGEVVATP